MAHRPQRHRQKGDQISRRGFDTRWLVGPGLVALAVMLGATLEVLDTSIVNVSLPHMQESFSARREGATWILTSWPRLDGRCR
jgi:MFS transporter, DHA2 family, multidrug resistance protein